MVKTVSMKSNALHELFDQIQLWNCVASQNLVPSTWMKSHLFHSFFNVIHATDSSVFVECILPFHTSIFKNENKKCVK